MIVLALEMVQRKGTYAGQFIKLIFVLQPPTGSRPQDRPGAAIYRSHPPVPDQGFHGPQVLTAAVSGEPLARALLVLTVAPHEHVVPALTRVRPRRAVRLL